MTIKEEGLLMDGPLYEIGELRKVLDYHGNWLKISNMHLHGQRHLGNIVL